MTVTLEPQQTQPAPARPGTPRPASPPSIREQFRGLKSVLLTVGGVIVAAVAAIVVGATFFHPTTPAKATVIDYAIRMPVRMKAGTHKLQLVNSGAQGHELLIFRTSLPAAALPVGEDGDVLEESPQLDKVLDSGDALAPNKTQPLTVHLTPGHYVAVCNLPSHYRLGMRLDLYVTK